MTEPEVDIRELLGLGESQTLRLTEDELTLVLAAGKLPRIVGFEPPEDVPPGMFEAAMNTLRARGGAVITPDGGYMVDQKVVDFVAHGARWARMVTIGLKFEGGRSETHWIYMGRGAPVLHSIPEPGIHQFQTLPDGKTMMLVISGLLRLRLQVRTQPEGDGFVISPQSLDEADRLRQQEGANAAEAYLRDQGFPPAFAATAVMPSVNAAVSVMWPETGEVKPNGSVAFTERAFWLWGVPDEGGYWILRPDRSRGQVAVTPANGAHVINLIGDFLVEDVRG